MGRFLAKIDRSGPVHPVLRTPCWVWRGGTNPHGYGRFFVAGRLMTSHRYAYETFIGPVPAGMDLDHLCRRRGCANPRHVEPVTHRENLLRGDTVPAHRAAITHCPRGHEYTPENTYLYNRQRYCRACRRARNAGQRPHGMAA